MAGTVTGMYVNTVCKFVQYRTGNGKARNFWDVRTGAVTCEAPAFPRTAGLGEIMQEPTQRMRDRLFAHCVAIATEVANL